MTRNNDLKSYECCILGAGPAGLGAALELTKRGVTDILLIDKNRSVGGLSRTDVYDGARFDIGPHRFFTKNKEVERIWHEALGKDLRPVSRITHIFYKNKYFNYPVRPIDIFKLGPMESLHAILSFGASQIGKKDKAISFEDWVIQKFGRKLYEAFFKTYTEKVWGIPCSQIKAEWAAQRIKGLDALEIIKRILLNRKDKGIKTLVEVFDYPVLGAGQMYEAICDKVISRGAELMLETRVVCFNREENTIKSVDIVRPNGDKFNIRAKHFFSSMPLTHFFHMLNPPLGELNDPLNMLIYRDHITVDLLVDRKNLFSDQWIYVHSPDVQMARVANFNNFSKAMTGGRDKTALCVEYFAFKGKGLWNEPDGFLEGLAINELETMGLVDKKEIEKTRVVRESEAYPSYHMGFEGPYQLLRNKIEKFTNLYSIGRGGMYKYNNMDHSILSGILAAQNYLKLPGAPHLLWDINVDVEYLEDSKR